MGYDIPVAYRYYRTKTYNRKILVVMRQASVLNSNARSKPVLSYADFWCYYSLTDRGG
jgi:hypothetical protein